MNTSASAAPAEGLETSCSDSRSATSTTTSCSSQQDLEWDNYSPPLCSCTDECSCTPSASQCISCGGGGALTSRHSCRVEGPCPALINRWARSRGPACGAMDMSRAPSFAWPSSRGGIVETDSQSTGATDVDLKSMESPSCSSRTSRIVSSTQQGVLESSIVISGRPSSASIDFRRKCTAYWDGVRSLHSISPSTGCLTEEATTCVSAYSLLSLPSSSGSSCSNPSTLRIFHSFSAPNGEQLRVDRRRRGVSLTRTWRPHSVDDIYRLHFSSSSSSSFSADDEPTTNGHPTKRVSSAVQFSQTVTTHCYDNKFSFHSALPVRDCDVSIHGGLEDQEEEKEEEEKESRHNSSDLSTDDVSCNGVHRSKQSFRDHLHNTNQRGGGGQQSKDHAHYRRREQQSRGRPSTDHNEDNPDCEDQIDIRLSRRDDNDHQIFRGLNDSRQHPWSTGHLVICRDAKQPDLCLDSKDLKRRYTQQQIKEHDGDGSREHRNENRKGDHRSEEHRPHKHRRHHIRLHIDSNIRRGNADRCRINKTEDLGDPIDRLLNNADDYCCDDSKEHIDHDNRGRHRSGGRASKGGQNVNDDFQRRRDNSAFRCDSEESSDHECHGRDLRNISPKKRDQSIRAQRERDHGDSHNDLRDKGHNDACAKVGNPDRLKSNHQSVSRCVDQSCREERPSKKKTHRLFERHGYKQHHRNVKCCEDTFRPQTDKDHHRLHEHSDFGYIRLDEVRAQEDQPDRNRSDGNHDCHQTNSKDGFDKDPSFKKCKVFERYSKGFSSDTESDLDDYLKDLRCRQSRYLEDSSSFDLVFMNFEKEQAAEAEKKGLKIANGEIEESAVSLGAKTACNIGNIPNSSNSKACEGEYHAEERQIDVDLKCCAYPIPIPPLGYFLVRARVGIEGDLDERVENASPLLYQPRPCPLLNPTPEPPKRMSHVEPISEAQSRLIFEPHLILPPQVQRALSRVQALGTPSIFAAPQPSVYMSGRMPKTPIVALKSTADGDRRPTSIRDRAENMPIVRRFVPMQIRDVTDQIEALLNRQSRGLKPSLVTDGLATVTSATTSSFVESDRRLSPGGKSVGWAAEQVVARNSSIHSDHSASAAACSTAAAAADRDSSFDSMASRTTHDRCSCTQPRSTNRSMDSFAEGRTSSRPPVCPVSLAPAGNSTLRSILIGCRASADESRMTSTTIGGSRASSMTLGGSRPPPAPNDCRLTSTCEKSTFNSYRDSSEPSFGPDGTTSRYNVIPDFESKRHSFGYSDRKDTVRLTRQTTCNPNGLSIGAFESQSEVFVGAPDLAQADIRFVDPSIGGAELIPAIEDLVVQIPSQTGPPRDPSETKQPCDDSDVTCLKELLAVPLGGKNDSDCDSDGQRQCKTFGRSTDACANASASGVLFCQPSCPSSSPMRPHLNHYPTDNCLCTSVTQVISRSMKHGTDGDNDSCCAAVMRDKCSSSNRNRWYRSLNSKTFQDIRSSDVSTPDRSSSISETMKSDVPCQLSRTSTWVDCYTLPGSNQLRHATQTCRGHDLLDAGEYGDEMQETSSYTDSVTTIYTRLPASSDRRSTRTVNCCALATESCGDDDNCCIRSTRCCRQFERKPVIRKCRQHSPEPKLFCGRGHRCSSRPAADDRGRLVSSTVVASLGRGHRYKGTADACNDGGGGGRSSREQKFERKYKALKRFCIETLGCVPPPPPTTPLCYQ